MQLVMVGEEEERCGTAIPRCEKYHFLMLCSLPSQVEIDVLTGEKLLRRTDMKVVKLCKTKHRHSLLPKFLVQVEIDVLTGEKLRRRADMKITKILRENHRSSLLC